jgi:pimeloyl-ACP methyl ester carboxylesterase
MQVDALAARHQVIVMDNRGVGASGKPPGPYSIREMADDAAAVLDVVGATKAHVLGLSMGGMIAQELALCHPHRIGALMLAATYARPGLEVARTEEEGAQVFGMPSPFAFLDGGGVGIDPSQIDPKIVMRFLMPLVFSERFLDERREFLREMFGRALLAGFTVAGLFAQMGAVMSHDTTERLGLLTAPTLVMHGTADQLVPFHHGEELQRLIPGAQLARFEGGTHGFNFEEAERFNATVLEFLALHSLAGV